MAYHASETKLNNRQTLLDAFFHSAAVGMSICDEQLRFVDINETLAQIDGLPIVEHLGKTIKEILPKLAPILEPINQQVLDTGIPVINYEINGETPAQPGVIRNWTISFFPLFNNQNQVIGIGTVVVEITDQKRTQAIQEKLIASLHKSEAKLKTAEKLAHVGNWELDLVTLEISCSDEIFSIFGLDPNQPMPNLLEDSRLIHPDDLETWESQVNTAINHGQAYAVEFRIVRPNSEIRYVSERGQPEVINGKAVRLFGTIIDITERKLTEIALQQANEELENRVAQRTAELSKTILQLQSEISSRQLAEQVLQENLERFELVSQVSFDGIWDRRFIWEKGRQNAREEIYYSPRFKELMGWKNENVEQVSEAYISRIHPEDRDRVANALNAHLSSGLPYQDVEYRILTKNGFYRWLNARGQSQWDSQGRVLRFVGSIRDITERKQTEAELQQTQKFLESVLNNLPVSVFVKESSNLRFVLWNPAAKELLGFTSEEVIGKNDYDFFPEEQADFFIAKDREVLSSGKVVEIPEEVVQNKLGEIKILHTKKTVIFAEDGSPAYLLAISEDITERKQAEIALRESEKRYQVLAKLSPVGIFQIDANGFCFYMNERCREIVGITEAEMLGTDWLRKLHPDDYDRILNEWDQSIAKRIPFRSEYRFLRSDGTVTWVLGQSSPEMEETGELEGYVVTVTDINDRIQTEEELQEFANRLELLNRIASHIRTSLDVDIILETVVESIRDLFDVDVCLFCWYRRDSTEPYWEVIKEANRLSDRSLIGTYPVSSIAALSEKFLNQEIILVDDAVTSEDLDISALLLSMNFSALLSVPIRTPEGEIGGLSCVQFSGSRAWSDSEVELLKGVVDNLAIAIAQAELYKTSQISAQIAQERALQLEETLQKLQRTQTQLIQSEKMSSLGQLVAGVAHEINNPVSFIYGNIDPAREYITDLLGLLQLYQSEYPKPTQAIASEIEGMDLEFLVEDLPKLLESMKVGAERIGEIVLSLRNFSRMDEAQIKDVDIHHGIDSTLRLLQNRLKAQPDHPEIIVVKEYGKLPLVECYAGQLNQVFMNLLSNAIDALEERDRRRTLAEINANPSIIRIGSYIVNTNLIAVFIADNGPGIPESVQDRIFDPFFTTKPVGKGTGLGLAISYQVVVEKHLGSLRCNSVPGKGTEFVVEIPVKRVERDI
ncbi:histidine kinase [Oscillatoriales cyanobacterium USR001]|nr:histidine kinase [Oscillatoriales cyanobacterium USR001]